MKRKLLSVLLCLVLVLSSAFMVTLFSGCNPTPPPGQEQPGDGEEGGQTGGEENGGNQGESTPGQTPDGTLPPSNDSNWGIGEMPIEG